MALRATYFLSVIYGDPVFYKSDQEKEHCCKEAKQIGMDAPSAGSSGGLGGLHSGHGGGGGGGGGGGAAAVLCAPGLGQDPLPPGGHPDNQSPAQC